MYLATGAFPFISNMDFSMFKFLNFNVATLQSKHESFCLDLLFYVLTMALTADRLLHSCKASSSVIH